jgi:uncharacterized repeat protein (TIGR03803 family)
MSSSAFNTYRVSNDLTSRTLRLLPRLCTALLAMAAVHASEAAADEALVEFNDSRFVPCNLTVAGADHVIGTTTKRLRNPFGQLWEWREGSGFRILRDFDSQVDPGTPRVAPTLADDGSWYMPIERHYYGVSTLGAPELYFSRLRADGVFETIIGWRPTYGIDVSSMLVQGVDRRLYGFGRGFESSQVLFAFTLDGIFTRLRVVQADPLSTSPNVLSGCGLTRGPDNAMYGVTKYGGEHLGGALYRLQVTGDMEVVYSFQPPANEPEKRIRSSVAVGSDGRLYGVANKTIYSIRPDGTDYKSLFTMDHEQYQPHTVKVGPNGDLYGVVIKKVNDAVDGELFYYRLAQGKKLTISPVLGRGTKGVLEPTASGLFIFQELSKTGGLLTRTALP